MAINRNRIVGSITAGTRTTGCCVYIVRERYNGDIMEFQTVTSKAIVEGCGFLVSSQRYPFLKTPHALFSFPCFLISRHLVTSFERETYLSREHDFFAWNDRGSKKERNWILRIFHIPAKMSRFSLINITCTRLLVWCPWKLEIKVF